MNTTKDHKKIPKWLKRIQQNSWEAEILISGLILFALFKTPKYFNEFIDALVAEIPEMFVYESTLNFFKFSVLFLVIGFVFHLILRGIWVGMVGLSYVFPNGVKNEKLRYRPKFKAYLRKIPIPSSSIVKLEEACSVLFSASFLMFGCMLGFALFMSFASLTTIFLAKNFGSHSLSVANIYAYIFSILGIIYFFDFISFGLVKRIKYFSVIYYPIYRFFNFLTLSFLYRGIYYAIITNIKKWKIYAFLVAYVIIIFALFWVEEIVFRSHHNLFTKVSSSNFAIKSHHYDNLRGEEKNIKTASIQSDIVKENTLRLFLVHDVNLENLFPDSCQNDSIEKSKNKHQKILACLCDFYQIKLDDSLQKDLKWAFYRHPETREKGITTWLDLINLERGPHEIAITLNHQDTTDFNNLQDLSRMSNIYVAQKFKDHYTRIPFFKE